MVTAAVPVPVGDAEAEPVFAAPEEVLAADEDEDEELDWGAVKLLGLSLPQ